MVYARIIPCNFINIGHNIVVADKRGLNSNNFGVDIDSINDAEVSLKKPSTLQVQGAGFINEDLYVGKNVSTLDKDIFVSGNAVTSGYYKSSNSDMSEFLKNLNFSSEIYPFYATYQSTISSGLMKKSSAFSLSDPDSYSDLKAINNTLKVIVFKK